MCAYCSVSHSEKKSDSERFELQGEKHIVKHHALNIAPRAKEIRAKIGSVESFLHKALGTGIVRSARIVSRMRAIPCACVSRLARMRANGVGNAHAHYYLQKLSIQQP